MARRRSAKLQAAAARHLAAFHKAEGRQREEHLREYLRTATGLLKDVVGKDRVNFVNSALMAEARGMQVTKAKSSVRPDFAEYLEVVLESDGDLHQGSIEAELLA